jgi:histidyl-tRNA synthetase
LTFLPGEKMKNIASVKGTRDFYPAEMGIRSWIYAQVRDVSRKFGYQEFDGPFLESLDLYAAKSGEELVKEQAFVFLDRGGEQVALRPELTPSLARMIAERIHQLPLPIRWWSFGPFWRYERPQKGRAREFFQWNVDLLGAENPQADAEIVAIASSFFQTVGFTPKEIKILVNNRRLMDSALSRIGIPDANRTDVFRWIDKKQKMNLPDWQRYLQDEGLEKQKITGLMNILDDRNLWNESNELQKFFRAAESLGIGGFLEFDPAVVRGLDYYTGTVFEARDSQNEFRAILGGGRYDNLVADVGGGKIPGVGFAMGDVVLELILGKYGRLPKLKTAPADVLVTTFSDREAGESIRIAQRLRSTGLDVEWYPAPEKLPKQLRYADLLGIPLAIILGPDEIRQGQATLKELSKREQVTVPVDELADAIHQRLARTNSG